MTERIIVGADGRKYITTEPTRKQDLQVEQPVSMEPAGYHIGPDGERRNHYTATQLAAARQQGADDWAAMNTELKHVIRERDTAQQRIAGLEQQADDLAGKLKVEKEDNQHHIARAYKAEAAVAAERDGHNEMMNAYIEACADAAIRADRIAELEKSNAVLLEALKYHQEQTRPIQRTIDAIAAAEVKP